MEMISLQGKTNFFKKGVGEYALTVTKHKFELDASFWISSSSLSFVHPQLRYAIDSPSQILYSFLHHISSCSVNVDS